MSFYAPYDPGVMLIKRIVALEGDILKTRGRKKRMVEVPVGHVWVEGDNFKNTRDSDVFGAVALASVQGRATHIVWPPKRCQKLLIQPPDKDRIVTLSGSTSTCADR